MKSPLLFGLMATLVLSSCGSTPPVSTTPTKTPFYISTFTIGQKQSNATIEKSGRITSSSSLTLTAQGAGEISKISVKEGQFVKAGTVIATLKDTQNNYDLRYSQAQNTLKVQNASIETTRINLEQSVDSARIAYERARQAYETLTGKNELAAATMMNANSKTLDSYNESYKTYLSDVERIMTQMLYEADKILGITTNFEYANDAWEPYLGTRVGDSRALANNEWNSTYAVRGDLRARIEKTKTINIANPDADFEFVSKSYDQSRKLADAMLYMLQNSVVGGGLAQELLSGWVAAWNGQRTAVQGAEGGYNGWRAQSLTFFKGYKNAELATKYAIVSLSRPLTPDEMENINASNDLKVSYENARIDYKDKVENARLSVEQSKKSYETAQSLRTATLVQLEANKENAKIALAQAERDYSKLRVTAPVDGIASKILSSVGQSVNPGSPITEFIGKQPQIIIDLEPSLVSGLTIGQNVGVRVDDVTLTGVITALSTVANANLLSTTRIAVENGTSSIGKTASILFYPGVTSGEVTSISIPLEAVRIIAENEGEIRYYTGGSIATRTIMISSLRAGFVETTDRIDPSLKIIITDTTNYDSEKHDLNIQL